jgi:hypothetical protein
MEKILEEIKAEREHQDHVWGGPDHDDNHHPYDWVVFIINYLGQSLSPIINKERDKKNNYRIYRYNMIKVAALSVAAIEAIDRMLEDK